MLEERTMVISLLLLVHEEYYVAVFDRLHINEFEEKLYAVGNLIFTEESTYRFLSTEISNVNVQ